MKKYLPVLGWLPRYTRLEAVSDFIAGVTLGLTMIPQSMAYAALAELTAQYGLYSCFMGGFLYIIFGTIKEVSIGPSSLMALITLQYTRGMPLDFMVLLCFLVGCIELLMGILNLGFIVDFISIPVTSAFMSATSVIIIISQMQGLLGLKYKSANIVDNLYKMFKNINKIQLPDLILGICSIAFLLIFKKLKDIDYPCARDKENTSRNSLIKKILWYLSTGRNALIVFITATIAYQLEAAGSIPFRVSGKIESGLPTISLPPFSAQIGNQTYTFLDMCAHYRSGLVILPLIAVLANVAIAKAFAFEAPVNATQEMLTLGLCNILGSFVSSMPTTGAFTRSAVSSASGIQTPMAGLYSGIMALLALSFLTPYFYYIPRATLSAILICAVVFVIDLRIIKSLWRGCKKDAVTAIGTFLVCVFIGVEIGLLLGILVSLLFFIWPSARPTFQMVDYKAHSSGNRYIILNFDTCLRYPAVASFCDKIMAKSAENDVPLILNCERFASLDYTTVKGIETLSRRLNHERSRFWLLRANADVVNSIDIFTDNKCIRLIESEGDIETALDNDALSSKRPVDSADRNMTRAFDMGKLNHGNLSCSDSRREDSESEAEGLALVLSKMEQ
ncbi:hypothetical protein HN011_004172 [Eciton burchellii]|nr:hypothetical protein HN011_004172 [Eciton burchellii]